MPARALAAALSALLLAGCAHVITNDPDATIWLDGRPIRKTGRIWSPGPPHTARILVIAKDGRRARYWVDREFSAVTLDLGLRTLGVCFILCWTYPQEIIVPLPPARPSVDWDTDPAFDPWAAVIDVSEWSRAPAPGEGAPPSAAP